MAFAGDVLCIELREPSALVVEVSRPGAQLLDAGARELVLAQVLPSALVEVIVGVGGAQQLEEVDAALRGGGLEESEVFVADVGAVAVFAAVACAGVIDVDIGAGAQTGEQELVLLVVEGVVVLDEQTVELARGDIHAPLAQLTEQQRLGDALVVMLVHDVADEGGTEVGVVQMLGQLADPALAAGSVIAREAVAGIERLYHQVLDEEVLIAAQP